MANESFEREWYALQTYSGYENKVKRDLEQRALSMGMEDYIFRVLVPEETKVDESKIDKNTGKPKEYQEQIFPGYVLVEMVMTDQSWYIVRNTQNVTGFVGSQGAGSKPAPLLPEEMAGILRMMNLSIRVSDLEVNIGDTVRIIEGAFANMTGNVSEIDYEKHKLKVDIEMFGRETSAELDFDQVEEF
ncbi:transcription antitermination protein nusG [Pilibacter termitis]|uniref:Transcription termination/antitermination protein NusG n=1 Tax=Pilibacter termitis TaxID=263852 RepID=A0A1T4N6S8_9ENTE|nr:transcription termination/antitermination protein NusG [Pilibacter termitis]SJZ75030.1 transcription antitermination protein nusG [Pilibacter termitis]